MARSLLGDQSSSWSMAICVCPKTLDHPLPIWMRSLSISPTSQLLFFLEAGQMCFTSHRSDTSASEPSSVATEVEPVPQVKPTTPGLFLVWGSAPWQAGSQLWLWGPLLKLCPPGASYPLLILSFSFFLKLAGLDLSLETMNPDKLLQRPVPPRQSF